MDAVPASAIVFSAIQPSGVLHLGNYLGAIKGWIDLQFRVSKSIFCIADLHSITVPCDKNLREYVFKTAALYLACGIEPSKSVIFVQSHVPDHTELAWIMGCRVPMGWLNRMTQFKDKSKDFGKQCLGLYSYPVLMASDILLYNTSHVPVGEDQKQHIELTRRIAQMLNHQCGQDLFTIPEALISRQACRIMSLKDGKNKMSKSDSSHNSRIELCDSDETIINKINKAKSDHILGFDPESLHNRPEANNLINLYATLTTSTKLETCEQFISFAQLKTALAEVAITTIKPVREKLYELLQEPRYIQDIIKAGSLKAAELSNLNKIKSCLGL